MSVSLAAGFRSARFRRKLTGVDLNVRFIKFGLYSQDPGPQTLAFVEEFAEAWPISARTGCAAIRRECGRGLAFAISMNHRIRLLPDR